MTIALIIALLLGGGTGVAAEVSNPGTLLYPVKVGINEPIRGSLAFTTEAKAAWNARLAERRLEETEKLSAKGKINAEVAADISTRLEAHVRSFTEKAEELTSNGNANAALEAHSTFESKLKAHAQVLAHISESVPESRMEIEPIMSRVQSSIAASAQARAKVETELTAEGGPIVQSAAEGKRKAAENKLEEVKRYVAGKKTSVEGNAIVNAETRLAAADAAFMRGDARLEAAAYGQAFVSYEEAMRIAQEAKVLVATSGRVKVDVDAAQLNLRVEEGAAEGSIETNSETDSSADAEVEASADVRAGTSSAAGRARINLGL